MNNIDICAICLNEIDYNYVTLFCCHKYCLKCIKPLLKSVSVKCPICRAENIYEDKCYYCKFKSKMEYDNKKLCMIHYNNIMMFEIKSKNIDIQKILTENN